MDWRFLNTGYHSGVFNMEFDESLVDSLSEGTGPSVVRVYGWNPLAISLGWNQGLDEIDSEKARGAGIDVVRRPTGGRAIFHATELTYSVAMTSSAKNILAVYQEISQALVRGLKKIGASVSLEKSQPHFPSLYRSPSSVACFSSSARYEIQIHGRKLIGSAQRRYLGRNGENVILQHGSLLIGTEHKRLVEFLKFKNNADQECLSREMDEKTTDLSHELGRQVTYDEVAAAVRYGFEEEWGIVFKSEDPEFVTSEVSQ